VEHKLINYSCVEGVICIVIDCKEVLINSIIQSNTVIISHDHKYVTVSTDSHPSHLNHWGLPLRDLEG
jgi:hypothetical protein